MTVLLIATFTTFAQHSGGDHKHGSPHGGTVKSAGGFHIEVSVKDGMVMANAGVDESNAGGRYGNGLFAGC